MITVIKKSQPVRVSKIIGKHSTLTVRNAGSSTNRVTSINVGKHGVKGDTGPQGPQGLTGAQGLKGDTGFIAHTIVTLNISPAKYVECTINSIDAAVTSVNIIDAQLLLNDDHDLDDLADYQINAQANNGSIDFHLTAQGPIVGDFKVAYKILN